MSPSHSSFPSYVFVHGFPHENIALGKSSTIRTDGNIDRSRVQGLRRLQFWGDDTPVQDKQQP